MQEGEMHARHSCTVVQSPRFVESQKSEFATVETKEGASILNSIPASSIHTEGGVIQI